MSGTLKVQDHLPLVRMIAYGFAKRLPPSISIDDLISSGTIGLIDAISKFDSRRGIQFKTYAEIRIRGAILDELRSMNWMPRSVHDLLKEAERAFADLRLEYGRDPTDAEHAGRLGVSIERLQEVKERIRPRAIVSIETPEAFTPADRRALCDLASRINDDLDQANFKLSDYLEKRDLQMLELYLEGETLAEIALKLGFTESRASQISRNLVAWVSFCIEMGIKKVKPCRSEAVKVREDGLLTRTEAAELCGVTYNVVGHWIQSGWLLPAAEDPQLKFKRSDLEQIRILRAKHGRAWSKYLEEQPAPAEAAEELVAEAEVMEETATGPEHELVGDPKYEAELAFCTKLINRARKLNAEGKRASALEMLLLVVDFWFGEETA